MACSVIYDEKGSPKGVKDSNGNPSKLFNQLVKIPYLRSFNQAIDGYTFLKGEVPSIDGNFAMLSISGEKGTANLQDKEEATRRLINLELAKKLKEDSVEDLKIKQATGWEQNPKDLKWRYEIPDGNLIIEDFELEREYSVSEILDSEISQMYPEIKIVITNDENIRQPQYNQTTKRILLPSWSSEQFIVEGSGKVRPRSAMEFRRQLFHEITHYTQAVEGFGGGGDNTTVIRRARVLVGAVGVTNSNNFKKKLQDFLKTSTSVNDLQVVNVALDIVTQQSGSIRENMLFSSYNNISGEVEARAVERRLSLDEFESMFPNQRAESLLYEQGDVAIEDQIFIGENLGINKQYPAQFKATNGEIFQTLKELIDSNSDSVSIGVVDDNGKFISAIEADIDTNPQSMNGLITALIKDSLIEDVAKVDTNGDILLVSKGTNDYNKAITSDMAKDISRKYHGTKAFKVGKDFNIKVTPREEIIPQSIEEKAISEFKEFSNEIESDVILDFSNLPDNELVTKLLEYLNKIGVKTTSIEAYSEKYKLKNGVSPSAEALADLANNIIAFRNGEVTEAELIEEVSHFVVDSIEESEKKNLKDNIHRTAEWAEFSETYFELYAQQGLTGEALNDAVREEILGKVLAKSLKENFQREQNPTIEGGIVSRLRDIFNAFFTRVNNFFKDSFQVELEQLTYNTYKNLMNNSLSSEAREVNREKLTLYSANVRTTTQQYLEAIYNKAVEYDKELRKEYKISSTTNTLNKYRKNIKTLNEAGTNLAIENMLSVLNTQAKILKKAVERAKKDSNYFSQEENAVYQSMRTVMLPMLAEVKGEVSQKGLKKKLDKTMNAITDLMSEVPKVNSKAKEVLIDRVIRKNNMTDEDAEKFRERIGNVINKSVEDTAWLHAHLGGLLSARDGFLNLAGEVIERVQYQKRKLQQNMQKPFLTALEALGFDPRNLKSLIYKGGIINEVDPYKVKVFEDEIRAEIYNSITGENITAEEIEAKLESILDEYKVVTDKINNDGASLSDVEMKKLVATRDELNSTLATVETEVKKEKYSRSLVPYLDPKFTKARDEFPVEINGKEIRRTDIPSVALDAYNQKSREINDIKKNAGTEGLSSSDKSEIKRLDVERSREASPRMLDGTLKVGVKEQWSPKYKTFVYSKIEGFYSTNEEVEADKVVGLQTLMLLNREFAKENSGTAMSGIPQKFLDELEKQPTEADKLEWLYNNASVSFEQSFWDNFDPNESLVARLDEVGSDEANEMIDDIRKYQSVITSLIKENTSPDNPSSASVFNMDTSVSAQIKILQGDLDKQKAKARELLGDESFEGSEGVVSTVNEAYYKALSDDNIVMGDVKAELNFILDHTTEKSRDSIDSLRRTITKIKNGEPYKATKYIERIIGKRTDYDALLLEEARKRLLPYFKRTEPVGYTEVLNKLKEDVDNNVANAVTDYMKDELIEVRPSWSFYDTTANINPEWLANRDAGREQYSKEYLEKVGNEEYFKRYGIVDGEATINLQEWGARKALLEFHDQIIDAYGLTGAHNRYQLPQMLKSVTRRILGEGDKKKAIKEVIKDWSGIREDDMDLGQNVFGDIAKKGDSLLTIPMYGVRKVKNQEDVTDELLLSYSWMAEQSALYRARKDNISDMLALEDFVMNKGRDYSGKAPQASNTAKMFKSFLNSNFYGVQESFSYEVDLWWGLGKIDLGKVARTFNNWVRFSNLAGITVPLTSAIQGKIQEGIEAVVKESINPMAYKLAQSKVRSLSSESAGEMMKFRATSELNTFLEFLGVYSMTERLENSNMGKSARTLLATPNGLHQLGNFPVTSTVAYAVALDYRVVNGKILTQKQYKKIYKNIDGWENNKLLYDFIKTRDGRIEYDRAGLETALGTTEIDEILDTTMEAMSMRALSAVQRVDSQIPQHQKSIASRNAIANFFLMHMNWFLVAVQNKVKNRHFNLSEEGMEQEGSWRTVLNMISQMAQNPKEMRKIWNQNWKEDEVTQRNILRTIVEVGVVNALAVAAILLSNMVDDDDDPAYLLAWADYMMTRVAVEQTSSTVGLSSQVDNIISNPIVSYQRLKDLSSLPYLVTGNEVIQQGNFAGKTERYRAAVKNLPFMKDYHKFQDWTKARETYQFFNLEKAGTFDKYAWASHLAEMGLEESE